MALRAVLVWFGLLTLAILNGGFREGVLVPRLGRVLAQGASTILLSVLIFTAGWASTPWIGPRSLQEAWGVGLLWVMLTLAFEFLAGHYAFGKSWQELLGDYNLFAGRIWILVLIVTLMTPLLAFSRRMA